MTRPGRNIKNLDTLEKEIYRLQLKTRHTADQLEKNFDHFRHHFRSMSLNSFFNREGKEKIKEKLFSSVWGNEKVQTGINRIIDHLADKAVDGITNLVDKILHRKD